MRSAMVIRRILTAEEPILRERTKKVSTFDASLHRLLDDMLETMRDAPGVGLAANQVGVAKRLMVIDLSVGKRPGECYVFINPEIVEAEGEITEEEGCLSIPDFGTMTGRFQTFLSV